MRAILSVWDKTGLVDLARGLAARGFELVASGGTARALADAGLPVTTVDDVTGFPEILGGRVKTLHPAVHGGILARRTPEHLGELAAHGLTPVDVVVCNLYPFEATIAAPGVTEAAAIEQIDIGGVTLLRAAAKNHEAVAVVCDPVDYPALLAADGAPDAAARRRLATKAFQHTAAYDAAIAAWMAPAEPLPEVLTLRATRAQVLRYGENSHQHGALYAIGAPAFQQVGGDKELSYNNIADTDAAWALASDTARPAVAIIKHANPCGFALADDVVTALEWAIASDPVSAFGGIIASNREVDAAFVEVLGKLFVEVLVAPSFSPDALDLLAARKRNCRLLRVTGEGRRPGVVVRDVLGGLLVQTPDLPTAGDDATRWRCVTEETPTAEQLRDLEVAWLVGKHVKSNAIVLAKEGATVGVGAGQMNRVDSVRLAAWRAGDRALGSVLASDAFFPFPDNIEEAARVGVTAIVQPGGSVRDADVIAAANGFRIPMLFTGVRHFRH